MKLTTKIINKILELKSKGLSLRDIAKVVGVSHELVSQVIRANKNG